MEPPVTLHQNIAILRSLYHGDSTSPSFQFAKGMMQEIFAPATLASSAEGPSADVVDAADSIDPFVASLELLQSDAWEDQAAGHLCVAVRIITTTIEFLVHMPACQHACMPVCQNSLTADAPLTHR